jgi:hypothetical protein
MSGGCGGGFVMWHNCNQPWVNHSTDNRLQTSRADSKLLVEKKGERKCLDRWVYLHLDLVDLLKLLLSKWRNFGIFCLKKKPWLWWRRNPLSTYYLFTFVCVNQFFFFSLVTRSSTFTVKWEKKKNLIIFPFFSSAQFF